MWDLSKNAYVGFMLVTLSPLLDFTHSLLMKRPVGWVYLTPLGAVSSTERPDMAWMLLKLYGIYT